MRNEQTRPHDRLNDRGYAWHVHDGMHQTIVVPLSVYACIGQIGISQAAPQMGPIFPCTVNHRVSELLLRRTRLTRAYDVRIG